METTLQDAIEVSVDIDSSAGTVWELVREPGWFINGGEIGKHRIETNGAFSVVHDAIYGRFEFEAITLDSPRYAAFRSLGGDEWDDPVPNTLIEFWIERINAGGVRLRVMESGFAGFDAEEHSRVISANTLGWKVELQAAKRHLSGK
ncbi:ATPase [Paeniglutamicibacter sp. NPDC091659]|uniref:ATPase n=1 Tax=Paeniglutamicibacter sp. NPDC091659 TaxID=3364389 RepID=UPI003800CB92